MRISSEESSAVGCDPLLSPVLCHTLWGSETFPSALEQVELCPGGILAAGMCMGAESASMLLVVHLGFWLEEQIFHGRRRFKIRVQPDSV